MKLHTTISSERGKPVTKSGNEYLKIEIVNEKRQRIGLITCDIDGLILKNEITGQEYETLFNQKTTRECKHHYNYIGNTDEYDHKCVKCGEVNE